MTKTKMTGLIAVTMALAACGGAPSDDAAEQLSERAQANTLVPTLLAHGAANGLLATTGNLYWTTDHVFADGAPTTTTLWRAGKGTTPGEEVALFTASAPAPGTYFYGNLSWPVGGADYAYFAVNYEVNGVPTSQIQRAPLAGGPATVVATSPAYIGTRDVVTDDEFVYWVDAGGVRKAPLNGTGVIVNPNPTREALTIGGTLHNSVVTLATTTTSSHLGLDQTNVYFEQGHYIETVPKAGGVADPFMIGYANVTAFFMDTPHSYAYWGEADGGIYRQRTDGGGPEPLQGPIAGRTPVSVGFDGTRVLWIDCLAGTGGCAVRSQYPNDVPVIVNLFETNSYGAGHLQWDSAGVYWTDANGVEKYLY